ncbi:lipopolysaccharide heptosyltransferase family protein, partial [Candidatus Kaiserbacteria bacterium]|nr:lipopolysaccharide heptosyltransferase family protein [Candidatus Kaiserbacteria bacterium]
TVRASSIGDSLMAKYLLEQVHARFPHARLGLVVASRGGMIRDLLAAYPWIEVVEANRRHPGALWQFIKNFWRSDLGVTQYTGGVLNLSTKLIARLLTRRGGLIGFVDRSPLNSLIYDTLLPHHERAGVPRLLECSALAAAGIPVTARMTFKYLPQPGLLERLGLQKKNYVVVGLFSGADARGLSPQRKQDLVDALVQSLPQEVFVFIGTKTERQKLLELRLPKNAVIADTSVQEAAALIDQASAMVSLGTGTSHIASHLRVPLCVLVACQGLQWVGTDQYGNAPMQVFCRPEACPGGHDYSTYGPCINAVDFDAVAAAAAGYVTGVQKGAL